MRRLLLAFVVFLAWVGTASADVTISGNQTRGLGSNGTLRSAGVALPSGGYIVSASDSGAGFWMQSSNGALLRFPIAARAAGTALAPGTWYAYPNLPRDHNQASVSVQVRTGGGPTTGAPPVVVDGSRWIVNGHPVAWIFRSHGVVEAPPLWKGTWTAADGGCLVTLGGGTDQFLVRFSGDGRSFTAFKNGQVYRTGVRQGTAPPAGASSTAGPKQGTGCCAWARQQLACTKCACRAFVCGTPNLHGNPHGSCTSDPECSCTCGHRCSDHK